MSMTPTSDERREVAERLRETRGIMAFVDALGIDVDSDWCWTDVCKRIADLIDPKTCQMVECIIDHGSRSWGMHCTACGEEFEHMDVGSKPFDYCPNCGARVVPDGDEIYVDKREDDR